ncbi:MAG: hemolysin family protein [Spirochaetia bacterium]|nr:hemolysin family protein [Spirochaetia bacterium]
MTIEIQIILFMLFLSAFFSGTETAVLGLGILDLVNDKKKKLNWILQRKRNILAVVLIGNNITIVSAALSLELFLKDNIEPWAQSAAFAAQIAIFFFLGEAFPKAFSRKLSKKILFVLYFPLKVFYYFFLPFAVFLLWLTDFITKALPEKEGMKKEDIFHFVESHIPEDEPITNSILKLNKTFAKEIMQPLPEITGLEKNMNIKEALVILEKTPYTRFPVYEERGDNIVGYVNVFDFLSQRQSSKLSGIMYPPVFVPETLPANQILYKMQKEQIPMVFPVNEYGGVAGLITLENIAEELVGDILSIEQTHETPDIIKTIKGKYLLDANMDIDDFNDYFSIKIQKAGFETITGFIIKKIGRIPNVNEKLEFDFGNFVIDEADKKTIHKITFEPK